MMMKMNQSVLMMKMNQSAVNHSSSRSDLIAFYEASAGLFTANLLLALPANVFVLQLMMRGAVGAVASELFALNLAVAEIIFCMSTAYLIIHFLLRLAQRAGLLVLQFFIRMMFISRPVFQGCICLERYLAVVHPTLFLRLKPLRYRLLLCVADWLLVLLYCTIPTFILSFTQSALLVMAKSVFFLLLISYCGLRVLLVLRRPGPGDRGQRESHSGMKRKAFQVIMITMVFTSSTELFQVFMLGPALLYGSQRVTLWVLLVSEAVSIVAGFITPLLFLQRAGKLPCLQISLSG